MRALCQTRALTPAMNAAVDPSVKKLPTNFTFVIQINKCVCTKYVPSYEKLPMFQSFFDYPTRCFTRLQGIQQSDI
jgi:hypothetical protein